MYRTLEVFGPEHEFMVVDENLCALPIVDRAIKAVYGRVVNNVSIGNISFGKELQMHVVEVKANRPFTSPQIFEENMQEAVLRVLKVFKKNFDARLLGTGMHPFLQLKEVKIWPHRDRKIYDALGRIFNIRQHGWLNIQSFQLNLSFGGENEAIQLHNALINILPYLPAITAASPIYDLRVGRFLDNRLYFYSINQKEIPSIAGEIIPEYVSSFNEYRASIIEAYSADLRKAGAPKFLLDKEWINSRGAVIRFDRKALEIRIMDEQECIKSDVALSCFIRALLRGFLSKKVALKPREVLIRDFWSVIKDGLKANVNYNGASNAKDVCLRFLEIAEEHALKEERQYLNLIEKRVLQGSLGELILRDVLDSACVKNFKDAVLDIYSRLIKCLERNRPYS